MTSNIPEQARKEVMKYTKPQLASALWLLAERDMPYAGTNALVDLIERAVEVSNAT